MKTGKAGKDKINYDGIFVDDEDNEDLREDESFDDSIGY
jgi:hypothetical protein